MKRITHNQNMIESLRIKIPPTPKPHSFIYSFIASIESDSTSITQSDARTEYVCNEIIQLWLMWVMSWFCFSVHRLVWVREHILFFATVAQNQFKRKWSWTEASLFELKCVQMCPHTCAIYKMFDWNMWSVNFIDPSL